jgi:flagellar protein FliO/FliZ
MLSRSRRFRRHSPFSLAAAAVTAALAFALALGPWTPAFGGDADADSSAEQSSPLRRPVPLQGTPRPAFAGRPAEGAGGWWLGTAGVALALALCGWGSIAARKYRPSPRPGASALAMRVIGRTSLSPRHSVYLLEVGGRVLIVGAGAQGAPTLLGELTEAEEIARVVPSAPSPSPAPAHFDHRLGEDEG